MTYIRPPFPPPVSRFRRSRRGPDGEPSLLDRRRHEPRKRACAAASGSPTAGLEAAE